MTDAAQAFAARFDVSRETLDRLETYHELLQKWGSRINLVSRATIEQAWVRHFHDSAQLFDLSPPRARLWADLGSGAGFPGLVIAILAAAKRPDLSVCLIEADQRKAAFLRSVIRETGILADVVAERIESAKPCDADVLSARALAPLTALLEMAMRHLSPDGVAIFPKGARYRQELAEALESFTFDCEEYRSETDAEAVILKIGGIGRV